MVFIAEQVYRMVFAEFLFPVGAAAGLAGRGREATGAIPPRAPQLSAQQEERLVINNDVTLEEDPLYFLGELSPKNCYDVLLATL
jgi:hypothetical protein